MRDWADCNLIERCKNRMIELKHEIKSFHDCLIAVPGMPVEFMVSKTLQKVCRRSLSRVLVPAVTKHNTGS